MSLGVDSQHRMTFRLFLFFFRFRPLLNLSIGDDEVEESSGDDDGGADVEDNAPLRLRSLKNLIDLFER